MLSTRVGIALAGSGRPASLPWRPTPLDTRRYGACGTQWLRLLCRLRPWADLTEPLAAGLAGVARPLCERPVGGPDFLSKIFARGSLRILAEARNSLALTAGIRFRGASSARWRTEWRAHLAFYRPHPGTYFLCA